MRDNHERGGKEGQSQEGGEAKDNHERGKGRTITRGGKVKNNHERGGRENRFGFSPLILSLFSIFPNVYKRWLTG